MTVKLVATCKPDGSVATAWKWLMPGTRWTVIRHAPEASATTWRPSTSTTAPGVAVPTRTAVSLFDVSSTGGNVEAEPIVTSVVTWVVDSTATPGAAWLRNFRMAAPHSTAKRATPTMRAWSFTERGRRVGSAGAVSGL